MSDLEQRLRAAMNAAAEPAPSGLMDGIRRRHQRHRRRVTQGSVAVAAAIGLAVLPMVSPWPAHPGRSGAAASSTPSVRLLGPVVSPTPPNIRRFTCNDATWTQLDAGWQARALRVGPLWLLAEAGNARLHALTIEVAYGTSAILQVSASSWSYLQLFGPLLAEENKPLSPGHRVIIFTSCPRGTGDGPNGQFTDFSVTFSLPAGRSAVVDVMTQGAGQPTQVTFTCTRRGCLVRK